MSRADGDVRTLRWSSCLRIYLQIARRPERPERAANPEAIDFPLKELAWQLLRCLNGDVLMSSPRFMEKLQDDFMGPTEQVKLSMDVTYFAS